MSVTMNCPHCGKSLGDRSAVVIEGLLKEHSRKKIGDPWGAYTDEGDAGDIPGVGHVQVMDRVGGYEDGGTYVHIILKVTDDSGKETFYRKTGSYDSWDGTHWEDGVFQEVAPKTMTVTKYEVVSSDA